MTTAFLVGLEGELPRDNEDWWACSPFSPLTLCPCICVEAFATLAVRRILHNDLILFHKKGILGTEGWAPSLEHLKQY